MYVVIAYNGSHDLVALGTPKAGKPFASEAAAERHVRRLQETMSSAVRYLVLPLTAWAEED